MENLNGSNADSYGGSMNGSIFSQQEDLSTGPDEPSTVDHALLESLFYNEMMQLDGSSLLAPNFLSQHLSEAAASTPSRRRVNHAISADVNTLAEQDLLRDFGVTSSPLHHGSADVVPPTLIEAGSSNDGSTPWRSEPYSPASNGMNIDTPPQNHLYHASMHYSHAPSVQAAIYSTYEPVVATHHHYVPPSSAMPPASMHVAPVVRATYPPPPHVSSAGLGEGSRHAPSLPALQPPQERTNNQLVSQFTTLASRLGVDLPLSVLQSLTAAAAANVSKVQARTATDITKGNKTEQYSTSMLTMDSNSFSEDEFDLDNGQSGPAAAPDAVTPVVQELRKTAEEAIAAVSENRKRALEDPSATSPNDGAASGRAMYSKRRKKPRLSDCETKLAELQAENELLKRHLANVSNKAFRFEQEKTQAGERFKKMLDGEYVPEQLEKAVQEFTDLYSDYGRRRQQELSFHLEQLQRLANPTNFTKMGLWTIAQNSADPKRNPIAGILQKELEITAQQGRKILDQREKIRALCDNLKECLALLVKLKGLCEQKTRLFHDRMTKCREILTSKQTVKLIIWINDNTQLLEAVCPGWGTEHIQSKAPSKLSKQS